MDEPMSYLRADKILHDHLNDDGVSFSDKVAAINTVAKMETCNCINKTSLHRALRWLWKHVDIGEDGGVLEAD